MAGKIFSINISSQKGVSKDIVKAGVLREHHGLEGDGHAGCGVRQVSLLAIEDIEKAEDAHEGCDIDFRPGIFAENITTEGIDLSKLKIGDQLVIGEKAILKIIQIGKDCPQRCSIGQRLGDCLMPKQGIFASVEKGAEIKLRDSIRLVRQKSFLWLRK